MIIKSIICNGIELNLNYTYTAYHISKISDFTYVGKLKFKPKSAKKYTRNIREIDLFEKIRFEILLEVGNANILSFHVLEDSDWTEIWYDTETQRLISAFDDILYRSSNYERFIPLYEDVTDYKVEFRRVR